MELTEEEIAHIEARRARNAYAAAYNQGLRDVYAMVSAMAYSETRTETMQRIKAMYKPLD